MNTLLVTQITFACSLVTLLAAGIALAWVVRNDVLERRRQNKQKSEICQKQDMLLMAFDEANRRGMLLRDVLKEKL